MATRTKDTGTWWLDVTNPYDWPEDAREGHFGPEWRNAPRANPEDQEVETTDDLDEEGDWNN